MYHVVSPHADAPQVPLPIAREAAHELADNGEERQSRQRQWPAIQLEARSNIDVVHRRLLQSLVAVGGLWSIVVIELGQLGIGGVEGKDAGLVDGDGDFERAVEVGSQSGEIVCQPRPEKSTRYQLWLTCTLESCPAETPVPAPGC